MRAALRDGFATVHTEGGLLPVDLLARIASPNTTLAGVTPEAYHLSGERLSEAINRSWSRLVAAWSAFREASSKLPENDAGTSVTRERWLLVLFDVLGYGRLATAKATEIDGKPYPISHFWQKVPIHLVGCRVDLDRPTRGVAGAARTSPHGLVQEFLNRSGDGVWGFVSNGLRLLRDNASLTRQAYVEFDLEAMMDGEVYPDFALLWLVCHQSRVEGERPEALWLERWVSAAREEGTRASLELPLREHLILALRLRRSSEGRGHYSQLLHLRAAAGGPPSTYGEPSAWSQGDSVAKWIRLRMLELVYTARDLQSFAGDLLYGGPAFRWDAERRFRLRCELDAAFFHLYGISRDDADYILDTFPIVKRNPPPADPRVAHGAAVAAAPKFVAAENANVFRCPSCDADVLAPEETDS